MSAPVPPAVSRQVFADMARLVDQFVDGATDDHRQQLVQLSRLLHKSSDYAAALAGELAETSAEYARAWQELDHYAVAAQQAREERDRALARVTDLEDELAELNSTKAAED
ncbi:hypothetical protein B1R94_02085 [Mycolicibacterium litorale]|nr:hypothetical protein B1R94_02085 [Mycolicibacterium litorale]